MGRPLPPELVAEIHKCLPLANAINVLVNVSKTFVINNRRRMLGNVQQLRASLNEYIHTFGTFEDEEGENDPGSLVSNDNVEWTPQLDALLRYGTWLTSARELMIDIVGRIPENFVEKLLLHMAHSSSTQMMLNRVEMNFAAPPLPMPTFLKQLFDKKRYIQIGTQGVLHRTILESIQLETDNGKILHIFDGELHLGLHGEYELTLIVENKDRKNWFQIKITADHSKEFIRQLQYSHWEMQPYHENGQFEFNWLKEDLAHYQMEENGNKLEAKQNIYNDTKFELFLRRGVYFSQFRHFKIMKPHHQGILLDYQGLILISYVCHTKHPEEFLESIDINSERSPYSKFAFDKILEICRNGIPKGRKFINVGTQKLHFLSAKTVKPEMMSGGPTITELQFTLANIPTNGEYVFDVNMQLESGRKLGDNGYVRLRIQKRKVDDIVGLKCNDQIDREEKMNGNGRTALIKMILTGIGIASILFLTPHFVYF